MSAYFFGHIIGRIIRNLVGEKWASVVGMVMLFGILTACLVFDWGEIASNIKNHRVPASPTRIDVALCEKKPNFEWEGQYLVETLTGDVVITDVKDGCKTKESQSNSFLNKEPVYYIYADVIGEGASIEICLHETEYESLLSDGDQLKIGSFYHLTRRVYYNSSGWSQKTEDILENTTNN